MRNLFISAFLLSCLAPAAQTPSEKRAPTEVKVNPTDGMKYVWIPPGTYEIPCAPYEPYCLDAKAPARSVTLTRGIWMGQTPVTVADYRRFIATYSGPMPKAPRFNRDWESENHPMVRVSWDEADFYCRQAGGRLPTEAEWEYAARAGSPGASYEQLVTAGAPEADSGESTRPVAQRRVNEFGLYDLMGNVYQWITESYDSIAPASVPSRIVQGPHWGRFSHVARGGRWATSKGKRVLAWDVATKE